MRLSTYAVRARRNEASIQRKPAGKRLPTWRPAASIRSCIRHARRTSVSAHSSALAIQGPVRVRLSTHFQAAFGESLKVVGSSNAVGAWDIAAGPGMSWTDGNIWALDLDLPEHAEFEYKIVHVHYNGTSWESCQNRLLQAGPALPAQAALDISCAYNHPELTVVQLAPMKTLVSLDSEHTWDPAALGLPADLTKELHQKGMEGTPRQEPKPEPAVSRSWAEVQREAPIFQTETTVAAEQAVQEAALQIEAAPKKQAAQGAAAAAGAVALALGAGVVMSALAIDLTDAAIASALLAAGATFLPAKDAQDARRTMSQVVTGGLNATEALARGLGLKSHVEQRAEREAALKADIASAGSALTEAQVVSTASEAQGQPDIEAPVTDVLAGNGVTLGPPIYSDMYIVVYTSKHTC